MNAKEWIEVFIVGLIIVLLGDWIYMKLINSKI